MGRSPACLGVVVGAAEERVLLPRQGLVAPPSRPQGSLLISLQGLWHRGEGGVCPCVCVRASACVW